MANFGAALTGNEDPEQDQPLKNIVASAASSPAYQSVLGDPASRSALLQIGLGLMQPQAMGQTVAGHVGEAIGGGGEAVGRIEEGDIKQQLADTKLQRAQDLMSIAQQKLAQKGTDAMTAYQKIRAEIAARDLALREKRDVREESRAERAARQHEEDQIDAAAEKAYKYSHDIATDPKDPAVVEYGSKTQDEVRDMIAAKRAARVGAATPPTAAPTAGATPVKPPTVIQGGHTYYLQPDGSYK